MKTLSALCVTNLDSGRVAEGVRGATVFWKDVPTSVADGVVTRGIVMSSASRSRQMHALFISGDISIVSTLRDACDA